MTIPHAGGQLFTNADLDFLKQYSADGTKSRSIILALLISRSVPIIIVFTKYDKLVAHCMHHISNNPHFDNIEEKALQVQAMKAAELDFLDMYTEAMNRLWHGQMSLKTVKTSGK